MLHRRDAMLRLGQVGLGALTLPGLLQARAAQDRHKSTRATAKSCILLYLWGGPPQQDMWDMKPNSAEGIRSHFQPIETAVPGIQVCQHLPRLATQMGKVALVRSLTHESNNHEPSVYRTMTGRINNTLVHPRNFRSRNDFPCLGSMVSSSLPPQDLPAAVTVPRPIGHGGVTYAGTYAGFMGAKHDPMETAPAPDGPEKATHSLELPGEFSETRLLARRGLLQVLEDQDRLHQDSRQFSSLNGYREQAFRMLTSAKAKEAFRLDKEDPRLRDQYGHHEYGESMLLARRLVEAGVRLVTISWMYINSAGTVANVWDNHGNFEGKTGFGMLEAYYCLPSLDQGLSALLQDLEMRGLLDETLVVAYGEFGRTPKINSSLGRDHWGACQTALLAGGGIQGGQVYGASDRDAAYPADKPVTPEDMVATIVGALGISPETEIHDQVNRPHRLCLGTPVKDLFRGS